MSLHDLHSFCMHYLVLISFETSRRSLRPYFLDKNQICAKKNTRKKNDIFEKFRKFSRNLEQVLGKFRNFDDNFQKEI